MTALEVVAGVELPDHRPYNGWCAVQGIPVRWHQCPECVAAMRPPFLPPEVAGVYVGGCVDRGVGSSFRHSAHAHDRDDAVHDRWVCVRPWRRLVSSNGRDWSRLMWHEFAHVLCPGHGHDDTWRAMMRQLGQPLPERYRKRSRAAS